MRPICYSKGFTLIEIIAVMLLVSVVGGMLYSYFNSAFVESYKPFENIQKSYDLHKVMENIIADYTMNYPEWQKRQSGWQKLTYYPLQTLIRASGNKGDIYRCTFAGKSGNAEPNGFAAAALNVDEGTNMAKWTKMDGLRVLKDKIFLPFTTYDYTSYINNNYGTYIVKENKFIKFIYVSTDTYQEQDILSGEPETVLKVTITNDSGMTLTNLFTNVN